MDKILIDTDVVLDFLFDRMPFSEDASQILSLCETKVIEGYITPVIVSNTYYLLRKSATHAKVMKSLKRLLSILEVLAMDKEIILNALSSDFKDFEYALQNFAAIKNGAIAVIVTRNIKDYKNSEIAVMAPQTYLKSRISK
jgi:predicted nucleic acid-binding protein